MVCVIETRDKRYTHAQIIIIIDSLLVGCVIIMVFMYCSCQCGFFLFVYFVIWRINKELLFDL